MKPNRSPEREWTGISLYLYIRALPRFFAVVVFFDARLRRTRFRGPGHLDGVCKRRVWITVGKPVAAMLKGPLAIHTRTYISCTRACARTRLCKIRCSSALRSAFLLHFFAGTKGRSAPVGTFYRRGQQTEIHGAGFWVSRYIYIFFNFKWPFCLCQLVSLLIML